MYVCTCLYASMFLNPLPLHVIQLFANLRNISHKASVNGTAPEAWHITIAHTFVQKLEK